MPVGQSQFTGVCGEYYVAYALTARNFHASLTIGNAPRVDVLVAASDGSRLLSLQVKTSRWAHRPRRYGHEVREWDVGVGALASPSPSVWYSFVDLQEEGDNRNPRVFLVPSVWVHDYVKPDHSRKMYILLASAFSLVEERWDRVSDYLSGKPGARRWATSIPKRARWPE